MIGIDIDGVLADFVYSFTQVAALLDDRTEVFATGGQLDWDTLAEYVDENDVWRRIDTFPFWRYMYPLVTHGEIEQLRDFVRKGTEVTYITSRKNTSTTLRQTVDWLEAHGFPNPGNTLHAREKSPAIKSLGITDFLDDNPRHLREITGCKVWVRDQPYNRAPEFDGLPRVGSLGEWLRRL